MYTSNITIYVTSKCNLSCKYCYIQKNQDFLNEIDKSIVENQSQLLTEVLNLDKDAKYTVQSITFWGGEPFLYYSRLFSILHKNHLIERFPYLKEFIFSTNFTLDYEIEGIQAILNLLRQEHPNRKFKIKIQLSIDGPEFINDKNRGVGSTQKFINNYNRLKELSYDKSKIQIQLSFKPTLLKEDLYQFQDINNLYQYFKFFEQFNYCGMWTLASPQDWNKDDGLFYSYIYEQLKKNHYTLPNFDKKCKQRCNNIVNNLTPIGNNNFCLCHRGYFEDINNQKIFNKQQILEIQNIMQNTKQNEKILKENLIKEIQNFAFLRQIDSKYLDRKNIIPTLNIILAKNCPYNNYIYNGNWLYPVTNEVPLYYNGVMDIILKENKIWTG